MADENDFYNHRVVAYPDGFSLNALSAIKTFYFLFLYHCRFDVRCCDECSLQIPFNVDNSIREAMRTKAKEGKKCLFLHKQNSTGTVNRYEIFL